MKTRFHSSALWAFSGAAATALFACTSTTTYQAAPAAASGPPIAAAEVGGACSGVGTSPGDTALFEQAECPAGLCVADARTDLDTYCTADCDGRSCPDGFTCADVTLGDAKRACLKNAGGGGSAADAGKDSGPGDGRIGTKSDKGIKTIDADISAQGSYTCDEICTTAGGKCNEGAGLNGVGQVERKYNDGSGTTGNQISSCTQSEDYVSFNTTMTSMVCYCDGMSVPPTVKVTKSEGLFACSAVCASWSMKCSASRESYAYADAEETTSPVTLPCATAPATAIDHYACACDP